MTLDDILSNDDLQAYLYEIASDDDILDEQTSDAEEQIAILDNIADEPKVLSSAEEVERAYGKSAKAQRWKVEQDIKRKALSQDKIDLSERISDKRFKVLISLLTEPHTQIIEKYRAYINKRLTTLLFRQLPAPVRKCWKQYRNTMRMSPGFMYETAKIGHRTYSFYATPDVPVYFPQHTERELITDEKILERLDNAVKTLHDYIRNKSKREVYFATYIVRHNIKTYFDLLKQKPMMFELLYNYIVDNGLANNTNKNT